MNIERLAAMRGAQWTLDGLRLLGRQPLALLAIGFLALMLMSLPLIIPGIGVPIAVAIVPAIFVGLMTAVRAADDGGPPNPAMLFSAFTQKSPAVWQPLLMLGAVSAVLAVIVMGLNSVLGGATMADFVVPTDEDEVAPNPAGMLLSMLTFVALYAPVQMALWYSPLFVAWHQIPVGKALFFSLVAVWRNRWAFLMMFVAWAVVLALSLFALAGIATALSLPATMLTLLLSPLSMAAITAMYCSCWYSYKEVIRA